MLWAILWRSASLSEAVRLATKGSDLERDIKESAFTWLGEQAKH